MKTQGKKPVYSRPKPGVIQADYNRTKTKKFLGRTTTKNLRATTTTDLNKKKFSGSGTVTKTVTRKNGTMKTKVKKLSNRRLVNL